MFDPHKAARRYARLKGEQSKSVFSREILACCLSYLERMPRDFYTVERQWDDFCQLTGQVSSDFRVIIAQTSLFPLIQPFLKEDDVKTGSPDAGSYVLVGKA